MQQAEGNATSGRFQEAKTFLARALKLDSDNPALLAALARTEKVQEEAKERADKVAAELLAELEEDMAEKAKTNDISRMQKNRVPGVQSKQGPDHIFHRPVAMQGSLQPPPELSRSARRRNRKKKSPAMSEESMAGSTVPEPDDQDLQELQACIEGPGTTIVQASLSNAAIEVTFLEQQGGVTREVLHTGVAAEELYRALYASKGHGSAADAEDLAEWGTVQNKGKKEVRPGHTTAAALPHAEEHGDAFAAVAGQALRAATEAEDLEVLCCAIDELAAVADAAGLAAGRAARHTLRKGKKKAMRNTERTKAALLMLQGRQKSIVSSLRCRRQRAWRRWGAGWQQR